MHNAFADLFLLVDADPTQDRLARRWQGVVAATDPKKRPVELLDTVRIAFGAKPRNPQAMEAFRQAFKGADDAFRMTGNELEVRVLAEAALLNVLDSDSSDSDVVALALLTGDCRGLGPKLPHEDQLLAMATQLLSRRAVQVRNQPLAKAYGGSSALEKAVKKAETTGEPSDVVAALIQVDQFDSDVSTAFETMAATWNNRIAALQEQLQILWWVFGETSDDLGLHISKLALPAATLVCAREVSRLRAFTPRALAVSAVLDRVLRLVDPKGRSTVSIQAAVNGPTREWRTAWIQELDGADLGFLSPTVFATNKSLESEGADDWLPSFRSSTAINPTASMAPSALALQACDEIELLSRTTK